MVGAALLVSGCAPSTNIQGKPDGTVDASGLVDAAPDPCGNSQLDPGEQCDDCHFAPDTPGLPMTQCGGYCDPNCNGTFDDADWNAGWYEYCQDRCPGNPGC